MKECTKCGASKPLAEFSKDKHKSSGYRSQCKECCSVARKKYYAENKDKEKETRDLYFKKHPGIRKKWFDEWLARNPNHYKDYQKSEKRLKFLELNKERLKKERKEWLQNNKEKTAAYLKKHYEENPEKYKMWGQIARARKRAAIVPGAVLPTESLLRERDGDRCFFCGSSLDFTRYPKGVKVPANKAEVEHLTPLSRGGKHTMENTVLSCFTCNHEKYMKTEEEYLYFRMVRYIEENKTKEH